MKENCYLQKFKLQLSNIVSDRWVWLGSLASFLPGELGFGNGMNMLLMFQVWNDLVVGARIHVCALTSVSNDVCKYVVMQCLITTCCVPPFVSTYCPDVQKLKGSKKASTLSKLVKSKHAVIVLSSGNFTTCLAAQPLHITHITTAEF